jgi:hypothetical protein
VLKPFYKLDRRTRVALEEGRAATVAVGRAAETYAV